MRRNLLMQLEGLKSEEGGIIRSVSSSQEEILCNIMKLHCPDGFECDVTYGNGGFWKNISEPLMKFDIEPLKDGVVKACSTNLPLSSDYLHNMVFDPPFLTYIKAGRNHGSVMAKRFGGYWKYDELAEHYKGTLAEAQRVLQKKELWYSNVRSYPRS